MTRLISFTKLVFVLLAVTGLITSAAQAQKKVSKKQQKEINNVSKLSGKASRSLDRILTAGDKSIPKGLFKKAKAVAVFPNVLKAAFIFGGRGGKGMISRRLKSGWSAPAVFKLGGGSAGFQIGGSSTEVVLLFMNDDGLKNLLEDKFEIGADASVAAGPVGRSATASTDAQLQAQILSYSRSKGLFVGVAVTGAVIRPDNDANQAVYGFKAKDLLTGVNKVAISDIPPATKGFQKTLTTHSN